MSASICANTAANFGLLVCILLLLASAMLSASLMISSSAGVNMARPFWLPENSGLCFVMDCLCSVKPERQNNGACIPVSPARLDQPRYNYPRKIGRRPMGGL